MIWADLTKALVIVGAIVSAATITITSSTLDLPARVLVVGAGTLAIGWAMVAVLRRLRRD